MRNEALKKYMTDFAGYRCSNCGIDTWDNKAISLHVDHISGNSTDNTKENLRFLCPNCHSQTSTYGNKNKGKGRGSIRKAKLLAESVSA